MVLHLTLYYIIVQHFRVTGLFAGQYNTGDLDTFTGVVNSFGGSTNCSSHIIFILAPFYCDQTSTILAHPKAGHNNNFSTIFSFNIKYLIFFHLGIHLEINFIDIKSGTFHLIFEAN